MIEIKDLYKNFGSQIVLKHVQMQLEAGKIYGIVGENGSGKTTLFRCIAGFEEYLGEITSEPKPLKNHLGYLPAEPDFLSYMTGREYLRLVCNARDKAIPDLDACNFFDLPLDRYAVHYSTGMKKKLAILGLILQENACLILDEPFSGLDIQSNILLTDILLKLQSQQKLILISSHIFSTLRDICDQIYRLEKGGNCRLVQKQEFDELELELKGQVKTEKWEEFWYQLSGKS